MKKLIVVAAALALAGCQSSAEMQKSIDQSTAPSATLKAAIVHDARDFLADPYSIRDAEISDVQRNPKTGIEWVCVKANAKNAMGGYTGRQTIEVDARGSMLVGNLPNSSACSNPSLKWQRFMELEALKNL
ncbi:MULTISPECIES: hypothetical protein [unclassified Mesorhizobium]|uniref:hypothetical protein n=1 Tax=unclassified Mesorhizobium TaxID=325217 RepID=UPI00112D144C|nr:MULTISPECIES: hypothetical protein [unclassified Mesorhizobium]TPK53801.1 hypothetical protein FJ550_09375 [Mesorhizobium sp. B2-5-2]TPL17190.1 hypothetical protein FJ946_28905 [Mesorhizobium sp. B2-4-7]TPL33399.1 hypothetical protein FJ961_28775 [Mesorhizobium sp. B2-4-5]TPM68065.1 hypothetical protein FJ968_30020 [Mesorhizobium sp. B2-1-6]TPN73647.1 hypothetical protein FJ985_25850 [Mesorhizobium sp. B1-1-2]